MSAGGRSSKLSLGLAFALSIVASPARAQEDASTRAALARTLRSSAFFGAELNARHRAAVYASDAEDGPGSRSELRAYVYGSGDVGPFGLYLGLGAIARLRAPDGTVGDPFADPYDDFKLGRSIRLFSAHVEYASRDEAGASIWTARLGRLTDFDSGARLLLYDGARLTLAVGRHATVFVYGGRRALLDGGLADGRTSALTQLVAGAGGKVRAGAVDVELTYRLEELHRATLRGAWTTDNVFLDLSVEARLGDQPTAEVSSLALVIRHDGGWSTARRTLSVDWRVQTQLGQDPVTFGRGGLGPDENDVTAAMGVPLFASPLDRLFLGPQPAHVLGELEAQWWAGSIVALSAGGFVRQPLSEDDRTSLRPGIVEVYGGPEFRLAAHRLGVQARYAWEDPGTSDRIFDNVGDGVRKSGALRVYAELPFLLSDVWRLAIRPEAEALVFDSKSVLSESLNQRALYAGLQAALHTNDDFFTALRYGAGTIPTFFSDGVKLTHDFELTIGGRY